MCCFDVVSCFGLVHHPEQQNNTPRPHPDTSTAVLREQKSSTFYVTACHTFTNEACVNKAHLSVFSHKQRRNYETSVCRVKEKRLQWTNTQKSISRKQTGHHNPLLLECRAADFYSTVHTGTISYIHQSNQTVINIKSIQRKTFFKRLFGLLGQNILILGRAELWQPETPINQANVCRRDIQTWLHTSKEKFFPYFVL